ncbi:MAG: hypothetical protein HOV81_33845 [Kofleriaceae bacterium]|nr:hypothetical protein [Kofleriaceae bacterium]
MTDPFALHHDGLVQVHRALSGAFATVIAAPDLPHIIPAARTAAGFLNGHHMMESEVLFPGLRKRARLRSTDVGFLDACDREHHELHLLNERLLAAATAPHPAKIAIVSLARDIATHLAIHTKEEEAGLSPERLSEVISIEGFLEIGRELEDARARALAALGQQ